MTVHTLFPAYVVMDYHSTKASHKMTLPTRAWNSLAGTGGQGGFEAWDASDRDAIDMVTDLATKIVDYYPAEVTFDKWTIYTLASEGAQPLPRAGGVFTSLDGGAVTPGWWQAVQGTVTAYDTAFNTAKLTLLDVSSLGSFGEVPFGSLDAKIVAFFNEWIDAGNAWASRAGFKPDVFRTWNVTLNNALYNQYNG
jgi:hypothetical protein